MHSAASGIQKESAPQPATEQHLNPGGHCPRSVQREPYREPSLKDTVGLFSFHRRTVSLESVDVIFVGFSWKTDAVGLEKMPDLFSPAYGL